MVTEDRKKILDSVLGKINKDFGAGSITRLGDAPLEGIQVISTGSLTLDMAIGAGGFPRGRIVEIYGPEASGKTLVTLHAIAEEQKNGGVAAFIDVENAFNADWAKKIGVDIESLIFSQPSSGEEAFQIIDMLIESGAVDIIVVDSVSALVSKKELDGDIGDSHVGLQARLMSQGLRILNGKISQKKTSVVFINQLRQKIGVMMPGQSTETTTGGKALQYYASLRLDIRRIGQLKGSDEIFGARTRVKVVKNKVARPGRQAEFDIIYTPGSEGVSRESDIRDLGVTTGFIKKSGSWFTLAKDTGDFKAGTQLGQGGEKARLFLMETPELAKAIEERIVHSLTTGEADLELAGTKSDSSDED